MAKNETILSITMTKTGFSVRDRVVFNMTTNEKPISEGWACEIQKGLGYDPRGYGFYDFHSKRVDGIREPESCFFARWYSQASCE